MNKERTESGSPGGAGGAHKSGGTARLERPRGEPSIDLSARMIVCPVCHLKNPESEAYCAECGFLLSSKLEGIVVLPSMEELATYPHLEDATGRNYPLRPGVNTLGRENTDILLVDRSVSRYHGMIVYDEDRDLFSVEDTGSTNGSQVNGEPLGSHRPKPIRPGDQLTFGNVILRFVAGGQGAVNPATTEETSPAEPTLPNRTDQLAMEPTGRLVLLRGNGPREVLLEQGITTIGRTADNKVCLNDDRYVSAHHARVEVDGNLFLLLDVGSTNGTFLNGLRLTTNTAIAIGEGDEVLIGGLLFQFHRLTGSVATDRVADQTLIGSPSFDHLSAATIGGEESVDE
jgi:pSer/pThr/pTyr-binding forkhead associated (FHA) protein